MSLNFPPDADTPEKRIAFAYETLQAVISEHNIVSSWTAGGSRGRPDVIEYDSLSQKAKDALPPFNMNAPLPMTALNQFRRIFLYPNEAECHNTVADQVAILEAGNTYNPDLDTALP